MIHEELDFQAYLQSVATTYAQWWQLYTLTDAEGRQRQAQATAPLFDFGLMVQTVSNQEREPQGGRQEEEKGEEKGEEKVERFSVLDGLRKYALGEKPEPVLLVGRPGSGKSTALARLLLEEATLTPNASSSGRGEFRRIPVLVELRYWQGSIAQLILEALARHELRLTAEQLETGMSRALLLFDGINELPSEEARSQLAAFRRNHPQVPMIFTTRDLSLGGDLGIERKLEMLPLTEAQMQAFIRAYIPEQAEAMLRQLKGRLRELGQMPLLLWMLCSLFQRTGEIPDNLGLVFRAFTQSYDRQLKADVVIESDRDWWQPVLQRLAWVMMQGETLTGLRVAMPREVAVAVVTQFLQGKVPYAADFARRCLRDLQKYHLPQAGTNPHELEFRHQLLQEYYAAEALLGQLPTLTDVELKRDYLNYLKWTEPIALMLALVTEESQALRVVKLAMDEVDLMLGARLAGEVKPELQTTTIGWLDDIEMPTLIRCQCWATSRSLKTIPGLIKALEDQDSDVRGKAVDALGELGSEAAIPGLIKALEDQQWWVHDSAVNALGELGSEAAIPGLIKALEHQDWCVRERAINTLEKLGSEAAITGLLKALENQNLDVRSKAVDALEKLGSEAAIPGLLKAFQEGQSFYARKSAVDALEKLNSEAAIPGLLKALEDQDSDVRKRAIDALEKLNSEAAIPGLLKALGHQDSDVRWKAIDALEKLGSEATIPSLLKALGHQDSDVCKRAVDALGKLGSEAAISGLLNALEHQDSDVRENVFKALLEIGSPKPLAALWQQQVHSPTLKAYEAITTIQKRCKFYNYEIWETIQNSKLEIQKSERGVISEQAIGQPPIMHHYEVKTEVFQIIEKNDGSVIGKQSLDQQSTGNESC